MKSYNRLKDLVEIVRTYPKDDLMVMKVQVNGFDLPTQKTCLFRMFSLFHTKKQMAWMLALI